MIWVLIIVAAVTVLIGIALLRGKCDDIIAGYSTAPEEERQRYDMKRLRLVAASFCFAMAVLPFLLLFESDLGLMPFSRSFSFYAASWPS